MFHTNNWVQEKPLVNKVKLRLRYTCARCICITNLSGWMLTIGKWLHLVHDLTCVTLMKMIENDMFHTFLLNSSDLLSSERLWISMTLQIELDCKLRCYWGRQEHEATVNARKKNLCQYCQKAHWTLGHQKWNGCLCGQMTWLLTSASQRITATVTVVPGLTLLLCSTEGPHCDGVRQKDYSGLIAETGQAMQSRPNPDPRAQCKRPISSIGSPLEYYK